MSEVQAKRVFIPLLGQAPAPPVQTTAFAAKGFRPFFLLAAAFAALILPVWLLTLAGVLSPATYADAVTWHAHEMLFGFAVAVIAGFLLTAVGNWTGQETLVGKSLLGACGVWLLGRLVMAVPGSLPRGVPALVDLAFLPVLALAIGRPLAATKNRRNFVMIAVIALIWAANVAVHLDALGVFGGLRRRALGLALDVVVFLMIVIAGRIVPMFTKNGTGVTSVKSQPALDKAAIAMMGLTIVADLAAPETRIAGVAAGAAALVVALRARTWGMRHTLSVPLLWILHAGHTWIVVGLALRAVAAFTPVIPVAVATHALTVGAIGALTIGMMARVTLGHTGRALASSRAMVAAFILVTLAALVRVGGPLVDLGASRTTVFVAGGLWTAAFAMLVVVIGPAVVAPRVDGKPG